MSCWRTFSGGRWLQTEFRYGGDGGSAEVQGYDFENEQQKSEEDGKHSGVETMELFYPFKNKMSTHVQFAFAVFKFGEKWTMSTVLWISQL